MWARCSPRPRCLPRLVRPYARARAPRPPPALSPPSILAAYRQQCPHPSLALLSPPPPPSPPPADAAGADEYATWAPIVSEPALHAALARLDTLLAAHAPPRPLKPPWPPIVPPWVLLSLLLKPPSTAAHAYVTYTLAHSVPPPSCPDLYPLVLLLSAYWLIHYRMYAPLRSLVLRFLRSESILRPFHTHLLLRLLAHTPPAHEIQHIISLLLPLAARHKLDLGFSTFHLLLRNHAAPLPTIRLLRRPVLARAGSHIPALAHTLLNAYPKPHSRLSHHSPPRHLAHSNRRTVLLHDYLRALNSSSRSKYYIRYLLNSTARAAIGTRMSTKASLRALHSYDPTTTSFDALHQAFKAAISQLKSTSTLLSAYFHLINAFSNSGRVQPAAKLLADVWHERALFDTPKLTLAVQVLTAIRRPDVAFRLLLHVASQSDPISENPTGHIARRERSRIDTYAVNSFMTSLLHIGRTDAVFYVWDAMPRLFGVEPDSKSLAILLKAARFARKYENTLQVAIADFGFGRLLPRHLTEERAPQRMEKQDAIDGLADLLDPRAQTTLTGFWRGERAGVVALRVAWQVFVGNWPVLKHFDPPFRALRSRADGIAAAPMSDLLHSFSGHGRRRGGSGEPDVLYPHDEDGRTYFGIVPEDGVFRALIDLLAEEDRAGQIPLVLTWMRYLKVPPTKSTLATALVYWGDVTFEGPWIESMRAWRVRSAKGISSGRWMAQESAYMKLVKWIRKWVGRENAPGRAETHRALQKVKAYREMPASRTVKPQQETDGEWPWS